MTTFEFTCQAWCARTARRRCSARGSCARTRALVDIQHTQAVSTYPYSLQYRYLTSSGLNFQKQHLFPPLRI
jgi:hypothetical protein